MQVGMSPFANISSPLLNPMGAVGSIDAQLAQMQLVLLAAMAKIGQSMTGASGGASSGMTSLEPGFGKASGGKPSAGVSSFLGDSSSGGGKGQAAVDYARQFSGKDSISIKGKMKHFTAALLGGDAAIKHCRTPDIMADAAYFVLRRASSENTGNFYIDAEVLKEEGIEDLSKYSEGPQNELMRDFFLD